MANYRRNFLPGGSSFSTVNLDNRPRAADRARCLVAGRVLANARTASLRTSAGLGRRSRRWSASIRRKVTGFAALNPSYALTGNHDCELERALRFAISILIYVA